MSDRIWTAAIVVIGDEILSGRTQDKNVAQIAVWLGVQGIRLAEVRVVADRPDAIVEAVNILRALRPDLRPCGSLNHRRRSELCRGPCVYPLSRAGRWSPRSTSTATGWPKRGGCVARPVG